MQLLQRISDHEAVKEGANVVQYCPSGGEHHRRVPNKMMGYAYYPQRGPSSDHMMDWEPGVLGWVTKQRYDGRHARAPLMGDLYWTRAGSDVYHAGTGLTLSAHVTPATQTTILGNNFLFEDGSVQWREGEEIDVGGVWDGGHSTYSFKISLPGTLDDEDL